MRPIFQINISLVKLLILIPFSMNSVLAVDKFKCIKEGKVRYVKDGQTIERESSYCINHFKYEVLNFDCVISKKCEAYSTYLATSKVLRTHSPNGNPYHRKCYVLGGHPTLVEYYDGKQWKESGICTFSDESFISVYNKL